MSSKYVKVRAEEMVIGALVGAGVGVAVASPLALGLPSLTPWAAGIGFVGAAQAWLLWVCILAGSGLGGWWSSRQERDSHVRGATYLPDYILAAERLQMAQRAQFSDAQAAGRLHGIKIGSVEFARSQEVRHIVANGLVGGGKTVLLTNIIDQVLARGDRVLIHDPKGDYTRRYFDPATSVLIGPWDARATMWDGAADIDSPALADEFAQACVGRVQGENKSFYDNAAKVIAGLIKSHMVGGEHWTWSELAEALSRDPHDIAAQAAKGDPHVRGAVPSAFREDRGALTNGDSSTFSIISSGTRWIANYAAVSTPESPRFSITRWLLGTDHEDVKAVFLNNNAQYKSAAAAIFGAVLQSAVAVVNSAAMPERGADAPHAMWAVLDELPQAGPAVLEAVQQLAELGRSRGIRCVLAFQDEAQLAAAIGEAKAKPMLAVQGTRIYLSCSDSTADAVSRRIGEREVNRIETMAENGATGGKTKHLVQSRVIEPSALMGLHINRAGRHPGAEMVLQVQDNLGLLVEPFPENREPIADALVESYQWRFGTLPSREAGEATEGIEEGDITDADDNSQPWDADL